MNWTKGILLLLGAFLFTKRNATAAPIDTDVIDTGVFPSINYDVINNPLSRFQIRNDSIGLGAFKTRRGSSDHAGIDLVCTPGETVYMPIQGRITREGLAYNPPSTLNLIEIIGTGPDTGKTMRLLYMKPFTVGIEALRGDAIGFCQDVSRREDRPSWSGVMIPHLHIELRINGTLVDPTNYITTV